MEGFVSINGMQSFGEVEPDDKGFMLRAKLDGELAAITRNMCKCQGITQQELMTSIVAWFFHQHPALRVAIANRGVGELPDVYQSLIELGMKEMPERSETYLKYRAENDFAGGVGTKRGRPATKNAKAASSRRRKTENSNV